MPAFDRRIADFEAANTQVLGISTDSPFSHENWAKAVGISHYPLLADLHRSAARDYGVYWPEWNANTRANSACTSFRFESAASGFDAMKSRSRPLE